MRSLALSNRVLDVLTVISILVGKTEGASFVITLVFRAQKGLFRQVPPPLNKHSEANCSERNSRRSECLWLNCSTSALGFLFVWMFIINAFIFSFKHLDVCVVYDYLKQKLLSCAYITPNLG